MVDWKLGPFTIIELDEPIMGRHVKSLIIVLASGRGLEFRSKPSRGIALIRPGCYFEPW
jgi:hypothetical protein